MSVLSALPTMNLGLLQSSCRTETGEEQVGLFKTKKNKWLFVGDTGLFDGCVHIPGILISLESQSLEHQKHTTHQTQAAEAFTPERPREKCTVTVKNMTGEFSPVYSHQVSMLTGNELINISIVCIKEGMIKKKKKKTSKNVR